MTVVVPDRISGKDPGIRRMDYTQIKSFEVEVAWICASLPFVGATIALATFTASPLNLGARS